MSVNTTCKAPSPLVDEELYFLILRLLEAGPCQDAFNTLKAETSRLQLLPKRWDWQGKEHHRSYEDLVALHRHIAKDHLKQICLRLGSLLEEKFGRGIACPPSLLGAGSHSLLRKKSNVHKPYGLGSCAVRRHGASLMLPHNVSTPPNVMRTVIGREMTGVGFGVSCSCPPPTIYRQLQLQARVLGHLSAVYCVGYDRAGNYIFTGADDNIVKIWSSRSGRLLASLRGHSGEIADMAVSFDNSLLATGSCDHTVRVWCLQTTATVAVLRGHTGSVTSLQFCPMSRGDGRYLLSTGSDGSVCFWRYTSGNGCRPMFDEKPLKFVERSRAGAQMLCSSFSAGGMFLATGSMDHVIRMYSLHGSSPSKVAELEAHTDIVDSIQHSNCGTRFISGSSDGTARVWRYSSGARWSHIVLLVATKLNDPSSSSALVPACTTGKGNSSKLKVTMVCWSLNDVYVMTAVSDFSVKVWDSRSGQLMQVLRGHDGDVFVVEYSPINPGIVLTAGHDGRVIIWDINKDQPVKVFFNEIQGQGYGAVYDCKFAPDGQSFAATDSHGHLLHFGFSVNERFEKLPSEMFFHTDYRPLIRDANEFVLDEQTQQPPHLMPPPFLVNIDGIPLAPEYQRLVPGRERCSHLQLVPQMGETPNGDREVLDQPVVPEPAGPTAELEQSGQLGPGGQLDARIAALQREHDQRVGGADGVAGSPDVHSQPSGSSASLPAGVRRRDRMSSHSSARIRRNNEVEGVRQAVGNVPRSQRATASELSATRLRIVVEPLTAVALARSEDERAALTELEALEAVSSVKQKPPPLLLLSAQEQQDGSTYMSLRKKGTGRTAPVNHGYRTRAARQQQQRQHRHGSEAVGRNRLTTRALYDTEDDEDYEELADDVAGDREAEATPTAADPASSEDDERWSDGNGCSSSSSSSDSSDYSDWAPDGQTNLQPPSRVSQRQTRRRRLSSVSADGEEVTSPGDESAAAAAAGGGQRSPADATQTPTLPRSKKKSARSSKDKARKAKKRLSSAEIAARSNSAGSVQELPEAFRLPDWLTNTLPRRSPYFPQMGDEVIYFRQGHELYLEAVRRTAAYSLNAERSQPWHKNPQLREQELMKVVGIKYDVKPPRLCCVKLAYMDPVSKHLTGGSISVKYHDMPDVIDFIVLKQFYDQATARDWKVGDRFRSVIDDQWWIGTIRTHEPLSTEFPDSFYQCFLVEWENKEMERMSPWDLEPLPQRRAGAVNGVPLSATELQQLQYMPSENEWPDHGRDEECRRLSRCFERIMEYGVAEPFAAPVDFSVFPVYAMTIGYPVDLSTIKARLDNKFYRRVNAIQFDVRHIESNAREFNEPNAPIVRAAELVAELCLHIVRDTTLSDPRAVYADLIGSARYASCVGALASAEAAASPSGSDSGGSDADARDEKCHSTADEWREHCRQLLDVIFECGDSEPFRQPVDPLDYPDYSSIIDCPSDFGTIREQLSCGVYSNPQDFSKDVKQVFINSKAYNTNKRSKIYAMTLRLQAMIDQPMNDIILGWRNAVTAASKHSSRSRPQNDGNARVSESNRRAAAAEKSRSSKPQARLGSCSSNVDTMTAPAPNSPLPHTASRSTEATTRSSHSNVVPDSDRQAKAANSRSSALPRQATRRVPSEVASDSTLPAGHGANGHHQGAVSPATDAANRNDAGSTTGTGVNSKEGQYVTRARTGNLKPKLYSDDAYLSGDSDDERRVVTSRDQRRPNSHKITVRIKKVPKGSEGGADDDGCEDVVPSLRDRDHESGPAPTRRCPRRACRTAVAVVTSVPATEDDQRDGSSPPPAAGDSDWQNDYDADDDPRSPPAGNSGRAARLPRAVRLTRPVARSGTAASADASSSTSASSDDDADDFSRSSSSSSSSSSSDEVDAAEQQAATTSDDEEPENTSSHHDFDDDSRSAAAAAIGGCRTRAAGRRLQAASTNGCRPELRRQRTPVKRHRSERSISSNSDSSGCGPVRAKRQRAAAGAGDSRRRAAADDSDDDDDESPSRSIGGGGSTRDPSWRRESRAANRSSAAATAALGNGSAPATNSAARSATRSAGDAAFKRPRRARPVDYREAPSSDCTDEDDDEDGELHFTESVVTTVSSRGRVRKLTSRARESFAL